MGVGIGASCGWTKDNLGERKLAIFGQGFGYLGYPEMMIGYYSYKTKNFMFARHMEAISTGVGIGIYNTVKGFFGHDNRSVDRPVDYELMQIGFIGGLLLFGGKAVGMVGCELCPLPMNWKELRGKLGLTFESGKYPNWLTQSQTIEQLRNQCMLRGMIPINIPR